MFETLKKGLLMGLGTAFLTKEKIEALAKQAANEVKLSEEDGKRLLQTMLEQADNAKQMVKSEVQQQVERVLTSLNVPTRAEFEALEARLEALKK